MTIAQCKMLKPFYEMFKYSNVSDQIFFLKIFRLDWPYDWRDLMPELMERIKYDPQNRALLSMHHVVKSLAGKRLYDSIKLFQDASCQLFPNFYSHWEQRTDAFIKEVNYIVLTII